MKHHACLLRAAALVLSVTILIGCGAAVPPRVEGAVGAGQGVGPEAMPDGQGPERAPLLGIDGIACVGEILAPPPELRTVQDEALLAKAVDATGKGKLCAGEVFEAVGAVTVYRVWTAAKSYTALGSWWALTAPKGPIDAYRAENDICPEWSDLDRVSQCKVKIGARLVIGPGQSADCENNLTLAKSPTNQVFIPNDSRNGQVFVEDCTEGAPWP